MKPQQKVLVIDDDLDMCSIIASTAADLGMECIVTTKASEFFEALTSDVTLIMIDLLMPDTDGIEILRMLGQRRCDAGIVVMSGVGKRVIETAEALATALGLSIAGHLTKPFSIVQLEDMLLCSPKPPAMVPAKDNSIKSFDPSEIWRAVEEEEFVLHYQPQIEVATGRCLGVEALVRWQHPTLGLIYPDRFIALTEEFDLIDKLTWIVIKRGLSEIGAIEDENGKPLSLSFNISVLSLRDLAFPDYFVALINEQGVDPKNIILEITETGLIRELSQTLDILTRLRMKNVRLSIDDFGTGYSMMQQLRHIPANELKIDKSLMQNLHIENNRVVVQKIIELGRELDMISVAEGVETREQLDFLRAKGCDVAQGYLFSKALPKAEFLTWFQTYQTNLRS